LARSPVNLVKIGVSRGHCGSQEATPVTKHPPGLGAAGRIAREFGYSAEVDPLARTTRLYIALLVGLAVAILALAWSRTTQVVAGEILLTAGLAGAMALTWLFPIPIAAKTKFYVDAVVIIAATLLLQPAMALAAVGSGTIVAHGLRRDDRDWAQALFNTAQVTLIAFAATVVLAAGGWNPRRGTAPDLEILPFAIAAAGVIYLLTVFLVSTVTALETSVPIIARFRADLAAEPRAEVAAHMALATVGFLAAVIASVRPWALILMGIPVVAIYVTLQQQNRMRQETERARMLSDDALVVAQRVARVGSWEWHTLNDRWSWSDEGARLMALNLDGHVPSTGAFLAAVHPEDRGQVAAVLQRARLEPEAFAVGHRVIVAGDGQERFLEHRAEVQPGQEGTLRYLGTTHDVTERVHAQAAMQRAKEAAEEASRAKTRLLSMASHDLRTPLTAIQGYLEVVLDGSLGDLSQEQNEFLEVAHRNTQHLARLVRDLLDLARIEAGRFPLQRRAVDVSTALDAILELLEPRAVLKGLRIEAVVAPGCPMVDADPERLHQVLLNLVDNAVKFTDQGAVRITAAAIDGQVAITVTDTGCGIDPAELPHIFDLFHQVNETAGRAGGSGLGLAIAKQFIMLHGGAIAVESALDVGTTMTIRLPAAADAAALPAEIG
jgi:signal transduction histidine kinase